MFLHENRPAFGTPEYFTMRVQRMAWKLKLIDVFFRKSAAGKQVSQLKPRRIFTYVLNLAEAPTAAVEADEIRLKAHQAKLSFLSQQYQSAEPGEAQKIWEAFEREEGTVEQIKKQIAAKKDGLPDDNEGDESEDPVPGTNVRIKVSPIRRCSKQ
jgi:hypothetical protein